MPLYDYQCDQCDKTMEIWQNINANFKKQKCECGGTLEKVLHAPGISFKGSGFYKTDKEK